MLKKGGHPQLSKFKEESESGAEGVPFYVALERALKRRGLRLEDICTREDSVSRRLLEEYGAMFVAADSVRVPPVCVFRSREEVAKFQDEATFRAATIGSIRIELQPAAMEALLEARDEALQGGLDITPRGGAEAARRCYDDTLRLWNTRFKPALDYWMAQNRLSCEQCDRLRALDPHEQVAAVLELEESGIFFSKDFSKSILYSVAAPGASQHLAMLAFDVAEFRNEDVRQILARHGWFQTVQSDLPHFTFLGVCEKDLPRLGLKRIEIQGQVFWIPNVG